MGSFLASPAIVEEIDRQGSSAKELLSSAGWKEYRLRKNTPSGKEEARIFTRTILISEKYTTYCARKSVNQVQKSSTSTTNGQEELGKISETKALETGSNSSVVYKADTDRPHEYTNNIKSLNDLPSVKAMLYDKVSTVIGFDTEFFSVEAEEKQKRFVLSYQFAFFEPNDYDKIHEVIFLPVSATRLSLWRMLSWILTQYKLCEAYDYDKARRWRATDKSEKRDKNNITLVCHWGQADLSTFVSSATDGLDLIAHCTKIQNGLVTLKPVHKLLKVAQDSKSCYNILLNVRDTMCFAPAGQKSLKNLGDSISVKKVELPYDAIEHMDRYFSDDPAHYMEYAANDSLIVLMYSSELWGINHTMPVTTTAGAVKATKTILKKHFAASNDDELNLHYRGIQQKNIGKEKNSSPNGRRFTSKKCLDPISDDAFILMNAAGNAYNGGFNGCLGARYVNHITHDFDLQNAYPTSMACIQDPAWNSDSLIIRTIEKKILTPDDFQSPYDLMFGDVEFEFPKDVLFPCLPVKIDGSLIFPRTSLGLNKCYASGPELYLAVRLGATVKARRVYIATRKLLPDGTPSQCLYKVAKQFVEDRQLAKKIWGNKSFEQNFLKIVINSLYGKTAQNIKQKSSWNAEAAMMKDIGCSSITSPVHACLTTAGVRAVLNATINQLSKLGYKCYSVTTDGFISDAPFEVLNSLDLYGFGKIFREARSRLTGSPEMWEEKHTQASFLNFSTRGNISQDENGVCARNGFHSGYKDADYGEVGIKPNGLIDRYSTMCNVALRNGRICSHEKHFTGFKELSYHSDNSEKKQDFVCEDRERNLRMDFDMKRKPLETSFEKVFFTVKGVTEEVLVKGEPKTITLPDVLNCEWMNFDSAPYENVAEYKMYRKVYEGMDCLRTKNDWAKFWIKIHALSSGDTRRRHIRNVEWTILNSVISGHRQGLWKIPALSDPKKTVKEKVAWINKFNGSDKPFTENSWKNCGRKDRKDQILSKDECEALLELMLAD